MGMSGDRAKGTPGVPITKVEAPQDRLDRIERDLAFLAKLASGAALPRDAKVRRLNTIIERGKARGE